MAITNAQQAKQILMEDGGVPQLVKKSKGKKRPGYRGDDAARSDRASGRSAGRADPGGSVDRGGGSSNRERGITQQYTGPKGTTGRIDRPGADPKPPQEFIGGRAFDVTSDPKNIEQRNFARSIAADAKRVADRKKRQKDLTFFENYLGPAGYTRRTKASNLKSLGMLDKKFGTIGGVPAGFTTAALEAFDVPKETAMFDIDSIREIYGPMSTVAGKKGITKQQAKDLKDLRKDMEIEQKILDGTLTKGEFLDYRDRNKTEDTGGRDDAQSNPCLGPNPPAYCFIGGNAPKEEEEEEPFRMALAFRADGGRVPYEDGGITTLEEAKRMAPPGESLAYINDDEAALLKSLGGAGEDVNGTGIKSYFIKKIFRGAKKAVKKIVKSPLGKAAILGAAAFGIPGTGFSGIGGGLGSFLKGKKFSTLFSGIGDKIAGASVGKLAGLSIGGGLLAGALAGKGYEDEDGDGFDDKTGLDISKIREDYISNRSRAFRKEGGMSDVENDPQYRGWKRIYEVNPEAAEMHPKHKEFVKYYANVERQGKEEGGLMDLKGMEMDFRDEGGFVPIGKKERADDVPARLSKNEFVMTADAVRGAGDGNIDKGAEKMYNLMSKLEAENDQSQGLDGARKMFKTAQRLEEVL